VLSKAIQTQAHQDDPEQSKRFIAAAREAKADETKEGVECEFKKVVRRLKPKPRDGS
jgi:hypothetical protein